MMNKFLLKDLEGIRSLREEVGRISDARVMTLATLEVARQIVLLRNDIANAVDTVANNLEQE